MIETGANEVYLVESKTHGDPFCGCKAQKMQVHLLKEDKKESAGADTMNFHILISLVSRAVLSISISGIITNIKGMIIHWKQVC